MTMVNEIHEKAADPKANVLDYAALITTLAKKHKIPDARVRAIVQGLVAGLAGGLKDGKIVRVPGFGALRVHEPAAGLTADGKPRKTGKRAVLATAKKFNVTAGLD